MESAKSRRTKGFYTRVIVAVFILFTAAASLIIYQTTRYNQPGSGLSSYSLNLETRNSKFPSTSYNFSYSCLFSESGSVCPLQSSKVEMYPGLFSITKLSSDVAAGDYRGIRVQITGGSGEAFEVKSATLQDNQVFDGRDFSVFSNVKGMTISRDNESGIVIFRITSDSASFDLDCVFNAPSVSGTAIKYTSALLSVVLFISAIFLISLFGVSARVHTRVLRNRKNGKEGVLAAVTRISLVSLVFDLLFLILFVCGQLFVFNEFTLSAEQSGFGRFMVEVSGSPYFGDAAGSTSFYSMKDMQIKVPARFPGIRISMLSDSDAGSSFRVTSRGGSCAVNDGILEAEGTLSCRTDSDGRLYLDFGGPGKTAGSVILVLLAAAAAAAICLAFRFMRFSSALRLMLVLIMISAYITGELCMNVEFGNILFYKDYLKLLPDVVLRNICLIIFIFLLAELSYSRGFICSGTFLQVLLLVIAYVAVDWGVFQNFGVRPDISTMLSHRGAKNSTFLVFIVTFFRTSHASWMVLVMLADWILMAFSFRQRENKSLKKYLFLVLLLNCIPFLKVYENLYAESSFMLRKDIFDIQADAVPGEKQQYTRDFPEYDWTPEYQVIEGLNRRKNVVILLVESLASAYSNHFSGLKGYMPEIDRLAAENASFINYHSTGMETAPATYSILTGKVFFSDLDRKSPDLSFEYGEALPKTMKAAGYLTSAIYSSDDFGGRVDIYKNSGFDHLYDTHDPAYEGQPRYVFNSVADGVLLSHAADLINGFDNAGQPHLTFILTTSSHTPFQNPETGKSGYREVISYVDREVGKFVRRLEDNGFFSNGTLIILGDHHPPFTGFAPGEIEKYGDDLNRVPLVIIDRDIGKRTFSNVFGHDSLGAIIEYLNLGKVKKYEYQLIPFRDPDADKGVTVICPMLFQNHYLGGVRVSGPNGEQGVYDAKGDSSEFASHFLTPEQEKKVAGRVKWLKREE